MIDFKFNIGNHAEMQLNICEGVKFDFKIGSGSVPPEPPVPPEPDWDKYEADHSYDIVIVRIDENGNETDDIHYISDNPEYEYPIQEAWTYLKGRYDLDSTQLFNLYYGDSTRTPNDGAYWTTYLRKYLKSDGINRNNLAMFRYPRIWNNRVHPYVYALGNQNLSVGMSRLKTVVYPERCVDDNYVLHFQADMLWRSGVENVVFRSSQIYALDMNFFGLCDNLREVTIPNITNISSGIDRTSFAGDDITITLNNEENSISGAPWGATNATVIWKW